MSDRVVDRGRTILSVSSNCTGCGLCLVACSFVKHQVFDPTIAYVDVDRVEHEHAFDVTFTSDCDACGFCWSVCKFDALEFSREKRA